MPVIETKGAASSGGFGQFARQVAANYIEDVFSTYLYTGTGAGFTGNEQNIINGIDLSGKGGLTWIKARTSTSAFNAFYNNHQLYDTARGFTNIISSSTTDGNIDTSTAVTTRSDGFRLASGGSYYGANFLNVTYASWTFRKQAKFFDVVTYTGNGTVPRSISHSLASVPGFIAIKCTSSVGNWICRHRSTGDTPNDMTNYVANDRLFLNTTGGAGSSSNIKADASTFTVNHVGDLNTSGQTYVAYIFAHDAGGFGAAGTDNVISCGSYVGNGVSSNVGQGFQVTLGWEPQWVIIKRASGGVGDWWLGDNIRGLFGNGANSKTVQPNTSGAEQTYGVATPNATGFTIDQSDSGVNASGSTYIYMAIRRGPMRTPTSGTSVFGMQTYADASLGSTAPIVLGSSVGFPVDTAISAIRTSGAANINRFWGDRLRGRSELYTTSTGAEGNTDIITWGWQAGLQVSTAGNWYYFDGAAGSRTFAAYFLQRAPGFFDVVCYTGNGVDDRVVSHNLGVAPELLITKGRNSVSNWRVYQTSLGAYSANASRTVNLNDASARGNSGVYKTDSLSATQYRVSASSDVNGSSLPVVAYLFATCPNVSKVGSYTGTGTTQQINCGFTGGARFVMIKRTDSAGDWYVWDSARGIVAGNDPYLLINNTAAEVTSTDYIDTLSTGFEISNTAPAAINANGGTYIFLAIA